MIFRQFLHDDLGCASYVVGDADAGVAAVVDPRLQIDAYLGLARYLDLRIEHVLETHTHADHVSGHGWLAVRRAGHGHEGGLDDRLRTPPQPPAPGERGGRVRRRRTARAGPAAPELPLDRRAQPRPAGDRDHRAAAADPAPGRAAPRR